MRLRPLASRAVPLALVLVVAAAVLGGCPRAPAVLPTPPPARIVLTPPLADVEVGEELRLARLNEEWIYTVVGVGDSEVRAERRTMKDGDAVGEPISVVWNRKSFGVPDDAVIKRIERTKRLVGKRGASPGKERPCWLLYVAVGDARLYYWISDEVGAHGVLAIAKEHKGQPDETHAMNWVHDSVSGWNEE